MSRRSLLLWATAILFTNQILGGAIGRSNETLADFAQQLAELGVFQYLAWFAIFRLIATSSVRAPATKLDIVAAVSAAIIVCAPTGRAVWIGATGLSAYLLVFRRQDVRVRAAAIILGALAVQQFWEHLLFAFFDIRLLNAETAVVGTMLRLTQSGYTWHDNVINAPNGHWIVVANACSSVHNLFLALLCWVTLTGLRTPEGRRNAALSLAVVCGTIVALNLVRLYVVSLNPDLFGYWHNGPGAAIFTLIATLLIVVLSLVGLSPKARAV